MAADSPYLKLKEAAELGRVHWQTIRSMIKSGKLRSKKIGVGGKTSPHRILREDVLAAFSPTNIRIDPRNLNLRSGGVYVRRNS